MRVGAVEPLGTVVAESRIRVGLVDHHALDHGREGRDDLALSTGHHAGQDLRLDLQVPCVVGLTELQDRASRRGSVAATLDHDPSEVGLTVGHATVILVHDVDRSVVRGERLDLERTSTDRAEVLISALGRGRAHAVAELGPRNDREAVRNERHVGERSRLSKGDRDREIIVSDHRGHAVEARCPRAAGIGMRAVLPAEDHVVGGQRGAIREHHAFLQLPRDAGQIFGNATVPDRRNRSGQRRNEHALVIELGQRLEDHRRGITVLPATRQIRVQRGCSLPVEDGHGAAFAGSAGSHHDLDVTDIAQERRVHERVIGVQRLGDLSLLDEEVHLLLHHVLDGPAQPRVGQLGCPIREREHVQQGVGALHRHARRFGDRGL